eukprot:comp19980_c0_seq1/m.24394 comp19980_c0_seq1/g.24394  ORF comp19980_c0_seq1/g.24394 comp19980_c0_seq1/m.24394 type:complete len:451 (-) comp19980_c0_seq1:35-1387(-)
MVTPTHIECRFTVALPAQGRSVMGGEAWNILGREVIDTAKQSLYYAAVNQSQLRGHVLSAEDQEALRAMLPSMGLVGFVSNGSILPRASGADDRPLTKGQAIPFESPQSMVVTVDLPNSGRVTGMGIRPGVTLIVGGGFHGKSTLLNALEVGMYNHLPGDGREFVSVVPSCVKIRAEDGRSIAGVDISPFIGNLPYGKDTCNFSTPNASGSTSQATNIIEALEVGSKLLLLDEDTCATNFMIRDRRMQALVSREKEPITPFLHKVRSLYTDHGVSTILVIGGSGDYFDVADAVIMMDSYMPRDVTAEAKKVAAEMPNDPSVLGLTGGKFGGGRARMPLGHSIVPGKVSVRAMDTVSYGDITIDLSAVEQIVETGQTRAIADSISYLRQRYMEGVPRTLSTLLAQLERDFDESGLDVLSDWYLGTYTRPRMLEVAAALNRLRTLAVQQQGA